MKNIHLFIILILTISTLLGKETHSIDDISCCFKFKATTPISRDNERWWASRFQKKKQNLVNNNNKIDILLLGDSITHGWERHNSVWNKIFKNVYTVNAGYGGDTTSHVLYRLQNGEFIKKPRLVVLMIGTNNTGRFMEKPIEIASGIECIIKLINSKSPKTKILLLAIFPRGKNNRDRLRINNEKVNYIIKNFQEKYSQVTYLNINETFFSPEDKENGNLSKRIMPDLLHLSKRGYKMWACSIRKTVEKLLSSKK